MATETSVPNSPPASKSYTVPTLSSAPREGLTPHANLIADFFLNNPSVIVMYRGMPLLCDILHLENPHIAWLAIEHLVKRKHLRQAAKGRACAPSTAAQLRYLSRPMRKRLLKESEIAPGWFDLQHNQ